MIALLLLFLQFTIPGHTGAAGTALAAPVPTTKKCTTYSASGGNITCTATTAFSVGEYIIVGAAGFGSITAMTVTDSASNTYTPVAAQHSYSSETSTVTQLFYFGPLTTSVTTVKLSAAGAGGLLLNVDSVTGLAASSPVDGSICYADSTTGTTISCLTAITTTLPNDYVFCNGNNGTVGDTLSPGSGFTAGANYNVNNLAEYQVVAAAGAITPTIIGSTSNAGVMSCAAFKP